MLNPYDKRYDYGNELKPPYLYKLDFAIGTTYSLNFDALIGACFSLCSGFGTNDINNYNGSNKDAIILSMLDKANKNVAIYCEAGKIQKPSKISKLHIKLEDSIFQIKEKDGVFHPKCWIVRYKDEKNNIKYRLIILSRNISFDNSWDVIAVFDVVIGNKRNLNKPLIDFVKYLKQNTTDNNKKDKIDIVTEELSKVEFEHEGYQDIEIIPFGITNYKNQNIDMFHSSVMNYNTKLFIMSPFLSNSIIKQFNSNLPFKSTDTYLITRFNELANIKKEDCKNFNVYVMNENLVDYEDDTYSNDIHAKIYFTQNDKIKNLYLGSLNATNSAYYNNVELMVRLGCGDGYSTSKIANSIINPKSDTEVSTFTKIEDISKYETKKDDEKKALEEKIKYIIRTITRSSIKAKILKNDKKYSIVLNIPKFNFDLNVKISPYLNIKWKNLLNEIIYDDMDISELSMFYILKIENKEFIIKIETTDLPDRTACIDKITIRTKEEFEDYLQYMLDDSGINTIMNDLIYTNKLLINGGRTNKKINIIKSNNLYEELLRKSYQNKNIIKEINNKIENLNDNIVDKEMKKLFKVFSEALR